ELIDVDRLEGEVALGEALNALGAVELGPLGAPRRDGGALAPDFLAQFCQPLGLPGRVELDLVDIRSREDERGQHEQMEEPQHLNLPARCRRAPSGAGWHPMAP